MSKLKQKTVSIRNMRNSRRVCKV